MRILPTALIALASFAGRAHAQSEWQQIHPTRVEVAGRGAEARATVVAVNVSVETLVDRIAERTDRRVEGFGPSGNPALVTVELIDRPLMQVLEVVLGSVGLSFELQPGVLRILDAEAESHDVRLLEARSLAHYLRATTTFPNHPLAAKARLDQGELEERRGNLEAAFDHYQSMLEGFPYSDLVSDAHLMSGAVLEKLGRYAEAHTEYLSVTRLPNTDPRRNQARLALARCQLELSNPSFAVLMVRRLEEEEPTSDIEIHSERLTLLAKALELAEMPMEALEVLDQLERLGGPLVHAIEAMEIRARALEALDLLQAASRAWLVVARERSGADAHAAYRRAADLTERVGDPLSVLFIAKEAAIASPPLDLSGYLRRARLDLGLDVDLSGEVPAEERWKIVQHWMQEERFDRADPELQRLFEQRGALDPALARDVVVRFAERTYVRSGLESALGALREGRRDATDPAIRAAYDLRAGKLLESERAYVRAAAAYHGDY